MFSFFTNKTKWATGVGKSASAMRMKKMEELSASRKAARTDELQKRREGLSKSYPTPYTILAEEVLGEEIRLGGLAMIYNGALEKEPTPNIHTIRDQLKATRPDEFLRRVSATVSGVFIEKSVDFALLASACEDPTLYCCLLKMFEMTEKKKRKVYISVDSLSSDGDRMVNIKLVNDDQNEWAVGAHITGLLNHVKEMSAEMETIKSITDSTKWSVGQPDIWWSVKRETEVDEVDLAKAFAKDRRQFNSEVNDAKFRYIAEYGDYTDQTREAKTTVNFVIKIKNEDVYMEKAECIKNSHLFSCIGNKLHY